MSSKRFKKLPENTKNLPSDSFEKLLPKIKENCTTKFDESIDLSLQINNKQKKGEVNLRTVVNLPGGSGKKIKVAVVCEEAKAKDKLENDDTKKTARIIKDSREIQSYHYRSRYVKRRLHRNDLVADITKWSNDFALAVGGLVIDCVYETGLYFFFNF